MTWSGSTAMNWCNRYLQSQPNLYQLKIFNTTVYKALARNKLINKTHLSINSRIKNGAPKSAIVVLNYVKNINGCQSW